MNYRKSLSLFFHDKPESRLLICFPEGNSGIGVICDPAHEENRGLEMKLLDDPSPVSEKDGKSGVRFDISTNRKKIVIDSIELDSIRTLRDRGTPNFERRMKGSL